MSRLIVRRMPSAPGSNQCFDSKQEGPFEDFACLEATLHPNFAKEVGPRYLAWDATNATAWEFGEKQTELTMDGKRWLQKTFKYPAQTLRIVRDKYAAVSAKHRAGKLPERDGMLALPA